MSVSNTVLLLAVWSIILAYLSRLVYKTYLQNKEDQDRLLKGQRQLEDERMQLSQMIEKDKIQLANDKERYQKYQEAKRQEFERLQTELRVFKNELEAGFLRGRHWLAGAFAEYVDTKDAAVECSLVVKRNPAWKAAETVSEYRRSKRQAVEQLKFLEYQVKSYEEYFPQVLDYKEAILDEAVDLRNDAIEQVGNLDPALKYGLLTKEEYDALPVAEKFQRALDRYWGRKKSKLEIGRLYERYVGYLFEEKGWKVTYTGIIKGFEDFGRDLICQKGSEVQIIQCKKWSKSKVIREKYIMQLFGTCVLYKIEASIPKVTPLFYATTDLSEEAKKVATHLQVSFVKEPLERYPMIKCNISATTGEKIYHLPFDQQYDKVVIGDQEGEFYANTIAEAEKKGFRRAYRWTGE